jgi:WD40 repeat protein/serine/threonine protein kinase
MEFRVLGSLEVTREGRPVALGGPKQRLVLAHLLIRANRLVPADTLIEEIWGDEPPDAARSALQAYVSRLRKTLGDGRIEGRPPGYVLHAGSDEVDAARFEFLVQRAADHGDGDPRRTADLLEEALGLWRGRPLADLADEPSLAPEVARLEELLLAAREDQIDAALGLGRPVDVAELERLTVEHPLRERLWGQLMLALYRTGRQAEALDAYRRAREVLTEDLGIDPSPDLQRLHERILRQDPLLELQGEPLRGYRLLERIGEGAFSTVHRAFQPQMGREVAVKAIRPGMADDPRFVRRFEAEAQLVARLEHPRIVPIYDYWREPGAAYIVMRYLRGGSLRDRLAGGPVNDATAVRIVDQVAEALHAAHRGGVIHGDVKPENILFDDDGNAYLADFGIAKDVFSAGGGTRAGAVLGTSAYTSPEQGGGEPWTPATDVYSLGLVVFEVLTGRQPYPAEFEAAQLRKALGESVASVLSARPDLPPEVDDVIARATAEVPGDRYPDPPAVAVALREALGGTPRRVPSDVESRNPFKGLRPFLEADAADFFGREAVVEQLVRAMSERGPSFLAVVGPSGSGKSSLVRAGLVPAVRRGAIPSSEHWFVVEMLPGAHPFEELEGALLRVAVNPPASLMEQLERDEFGLLRAVKRVLPDDDSELLIVIDQFEELFTLVADEARRITFLASLAAAVSDPGGRVRIVVTLRADFYDRPLEYRNFAQLLSTRTLVVSPPSIGELEQAVTGPAEAVGVTVEPRVVAEILSDVADQPGALPLMQYALTELFAERRNSVLTLEAYHRIGGVTGAIARRADALHDAQGPDGRAAARQLFLRLIALGEEGAEDTRRRVLLEDLASLEADRVAMTSVIDAYGERRLLSFDRDPVTRGPTVEVAHEALLRRWGRLRGWVEGAREDLRMHHRLDAAAAEWTKSGQDPSFLLRGSRLGQFEAWAAATDVALSDRERRYLESGLAQRDVERAEEEVRQKREAVLERRSVVRLRALIAILTIAALVASLLSIVAVRQRSSAQRIAREATARELASAAVANLDVDPERSILLALQAVATTRQDGDVVPEAVEALHGAVAADRQILTLRNPSTANVAWSPDGRLIGTGGSVGGNDQNDVILWDARTGAKLLTLKGHTGDIGYLAFSPDSSRLVTTGDDDRAIVWDTSTGARLHTIPNVRNGAGTFSPDGRRIVLGSIDGSAEVVDAATGRRSLELSPAAGLCQSPVFSPDGSRIAAPALDGVPIWSARTGDVLHFLSLPDGSCNVAFSPDGQELAGSSGNEVVVWNTHTWTTVERLQGHSGGVIGLDWSRDGTRIATGANDGTARIWDAATGAQILELAGHAGLVANVAFSPDGTRLVTGGGDGTARVWDVSPAATAEWFGDAEPGTMFGVAYAPDGRSLLTTGFGPGQGAWRWDAATGRRIGGYPDVYEAEFAGDGSAMLVGDRVEIARPGSPVSSLNKVPTGAFGLGYARDGSLIAEPGGQRKSIVVWTSDGRRVGSFGPAGPDDAFIQTAFSPDGSLLAGLTGRATLDVWDVATGTALFQHRVSTGQARSMAFSPKGSRLVTSGADGASVWAIPSGRRVARLSGAGAIGAVAFSPDGKRVATGGDDGTARIWDAATGEEQLTLTGNTDTLTGVAFSPDGTRLATTAQDGTLRVYVLPVDQLVRIAESRLTRWFTTAECKQYLHVATCPSGLTRAPTTTGEVPAPYGPEGAYRVTIARSELQRAGINRSGIPSLLGAFTLSLTHGTWRLHLERFDGGTDDRVGRYTISGRRITLEILDDTCTFGGSWSADWSATPTDLTLTNIASNVPAACDPVDFQAVTSAVFGSRPLTRVL